MYCSGLTTKSDRRRYFRGLIRPPPPTAKHRAALSDAAFLGVRTREPPARHKPIAACMTSSAQCLMFVGWLVFGVSACCLSCLACLPQPQAPLPEPSSLICIARAGLADPRLCPRVHPPLILWRMHAWRELAQRARGRMQADVRTLGGPDESERPHGGQRPKDQHGTAPQSRHDLASTARNARHRMGEASKILPAA